ncbi:quino protein, putative [Microscilla marina ATCC 23134]|uniref:Quino protein, putative n=2 Tax=Microscilla marina TaxID=1027 RepID=A2A0P5_MICM2|nr:quino protein, putative [Microscilla marina ATCC 23134]
MKISHVSDQKLYSEYYSEDDDQSYFFCYDLDKQKIIWEHLLGEVSVVSSALSNGILILNLERKCVHALDTQTGKIIWQNDQFGTFYDSHVKTEKPCTLSGFPIIIDENIILSLLGYKIVSLNLKNGKIKWETQVKERTPSSITYYIDGNIYLIGNQTYCAINPSNGNKIFEKNIKQEFLDHGYVRLTLTSITEDHIHFSDIDKGKYFIIDKVSGKTLWSYECKSMIPSYHYPIITKNEIYIVDDKGNFYVFSKN